MKSKIKQLSSIYLQNPLHYSILIILLIGSLFVRTYRTHDLLRFYYDQGRDALVIHEMITTPKPVLVGPTTGLAGILRGPAFYYLLLPAYLFSGGSPIFASIWLQLINVVGLIFIYLIAKKLFSPLAGLIAIFTFGFSNGIVDLSRWLSNPSPIFTSVPIMIYGLLKIRDNQKPHLWWPIVALMLGLNLQFEMASEFWFLPALAILILIAPKYRPNFKTALISGLVFFATLIPQLAFDIRHGGIMRAGIASHFASSQEKSFLFSFPLIHDRLVFYLDTFTGYFTPQINFILLFFLILLIFNLILSSHRKSYAFLSLLAGIPLLVLAFYHGNQGNFYSYYLIGLLPVIFLIISGLLASLFQKPSLWIIPLTILTLFARTNFTNLRNFLIAGVDGPEHISLGNQLQIIDWIYQDASGQPFSIDVYVPPVIPYSYDYLFIWYGEKHYGYQPSLDLISPLYTIYEVDPPHPERLTAWLERQAGIGTIEQEVSFGGVTVQRRSRLTN